MVQKIYYALATMIAFTGAIFFFMASPAFADTLSIVCDGARIPKSLSNHSACSSAVSTLPGDVIILEGSVSSVSQPARFKPQHVTFSGNGRTQRAALTAISPRTLNVVGGKFVVAAIVPDDLPAGGYTLSIGIEGKCYKNVHGARICPTSTVQSSITIASITGTSEFDFTCLANDYTGNKKISCPRSSGFKLSLKGLRGVAGNIAFVYLRKNNEYFLGRKIDLNKNAGQITYWMPDAIGEYEIVVRNRAVTGRTYPGDQEVVGPKITIVELEKKKVVEDKDERILSAVEMTEISITVATYITDNNTAFAPRIQRNIPGSLIPGQPFAVKVKHTNGPPFTQQHKVKMELTSDSTTLAKIWNLGTFEVNSHESIGTLKEGKWYIWHSVVPYELYAEVKSNDHKQYTLKITAIDETPFIKEDNYEASIPVAIEIPRLFSPSTEGYNKGLLVSPKKPELAEDIIITPDPSFTLKGSNFPPGAKITKVYFGQRKVWEHTDNRVYKEINKNVSRDGTFAAIIDISNDKSKIIEQLGGRTTMQISVEIEETVPINFVEHEKKVEEFKKNENSKNGKHIFDIVGVAKIVGGVVDAGETRSDTEMKQSKSKQEETQTPAEQAQPTNGKTKQRHFCDIWLGISEKFLMGCRSSEGLSLDGSAKPASAPTPVPKPKPALSVERVQEKKITTDCEDVITFWRKPGENCEWKEKPAVEEPAKPAPEPEPKPAPAPKVEPKLTTVDEAKENPCAGKEGYQLSQCKYFYGITDDKKPEAKKPVADVKKPVAPTPPPKQTQTLPVERVQEKKITTDCEDVISFWRKPGENCVWKDNLVTEEPVKPAPAPTQTPKVESKSTSIDEPQENPCAGKEGYQLSQCKYFHGITNDTKPEAKEPESAKDELNQLKEVTYCKPDKPITFQPGCVER